MSADTRMIRVLVVDDHPVLREGIAALLEGEPDLQLVAEAANGLEAIHRYRDHQPDVTLMDIQMPDMNGIDAIAAIRHEFPDARIAVLTTYSGDAQALRALRAGAVGYLLKSALRKELVDTIRRIHAGAWHIPTEVAAGIAEHAVADAVSPRELQVLRQVADGLSNREIALRLDIAEDTVKAHMKNILSKLGANDRTHAVTIALRRGLIDL